MENNIETSIYKLAQEVAQSKGMQLVETEIKKSGNRDTLVVTIQREGGVGVNDCADVSRELDVLLEAEGLLKDSFTLEVSSPGITRPLKTQRDFELKIGKQIKVKYINEENTINSTIGRLESVDNRELILNSKEGAFGIKLDSIKSAKMEITI